MEDFIKPDKVEEEIVLKADKVIMCKTDKEGIFEFANEYFMEVSGYEEYELMGKSMFCIQHPDMPEVIFKMMWEKLLAKENFNVVVKNIAKTGKFYWSVTNFDFKLDDKGEIIAIYSKRVAASRDSIEFFSKLYKTLLRIESENGIEASEKYLNGYLEEKRLNFKELVKQFYDDLAETPKAKKIKTETPKPIIKEETPKIEKEFELKLPKSPQVIAKPQSKPIEKSKVIEKIEEKKETKKSIEVKKVIEAKKEVEPKKVVKVEKKAISKIEIKKDKIIGEKPKKSIFQKLFGKTDEEIEEERKRREKN